MRTTILIATLLIISVDLFSQGGVNVKYIAIDTVDKNLIGQKVKIDFKSANGTKEHLMQRARTRDTVKIAIDDRLINVIECKGIGVDYWEFDREYLESFDYNSGIILRIKEIESLDMRTDSIQFRMTLDQFKKINEKLEKVSSEIRDIWILKDKIDGLLIKDW